MRYGSKPIAVDGAQHRLGGGDAHLVLRRAPAGEDPEPQPLPAHGAASGAGHAPTNSISYSSDPKAVGNGGPHPIAERANVGRASAAVGDDEVRVQVADARAADALPLQARGVDEPAGVIARRIAEDAPGVLVGERLRRLAARLEGGHVGGDRRTIPAAQRQLRGDHDLGRVLEPRVAVREGARIPRQVVQRAVAGVPGLDPGHDVPHLAAVRAGIGPHRAAERTGDADPERDARQLRGHGTPHERRHRHPRIATQRGARHVESRARLRTTSPRMPASATTRSLPLPMTKSGTSAARAAVSTASSSSRLRGVASRSAGPPTRSVVSGAIGASTASRMPRSAASASRRARLAAAVTVMRIDRPSPTSSVARQVPRRRAARAPGRRQPFAAVARRPGARHPATRTRSGVGRRRPRAAPRPGRRGTRRSHADARRHAGMARGSRRRRRRRPRRTSTSRRARGRGRQRRAHRSCGG